MFSHLFLLSDCFPQTLSMRRARVPDCVWRGSGEGGERAAGCDRREFFRFRRALAIPMAACYEEFGNKGPLFSATKPRSALVSFCKTAENCFLASIVANCRKIGGIIRAARAGEFEGGEFTFDEEIERSPLSFFLSSPPLARPLSPAPPTQLTNNEVLRFHRPRPRALRRVRPGE